MEVIIVDNNSSVGLLSWIQKSFPNYGCISSDQNLGFAKANNLGVSHANADHILILNPDTIISEELIQKALTLLRADSKIGAVAAKMVDGRGEYLPESARGFPDLSSSFLKMLGLKKWSSYYQKPDTNGCIEVMSGACMFFNKQTYLDIGGLDERYFMYGEDIDISYQIHKAGSSIKYIDELEIVHFKGRSSVKSNWRYQTSFYNAMKLYWQKNFHWGRQPLLNFALGIALWMLKVLSALRHSVQTIAFPLIDFTGILLVSSAFTYFWSVWVKKDLGFVPTNFYWIFLPIYTLIALISLLFAKFYIDQFDISKLVKATLANIALFLMIYFILPIEFKYSRAVLIILWAISFFVPLIFRWIFAKYKNIPLLYKDTRYLEAAIVPNPKNEAKLADLLNKFSNYRLIKNQKKEDVCIVDAEQIANSDLIQYICNSGQKQSVWIFSTSGNYLLKTHGKDEDGYIIAENENFTIYEWTNKLRKRVLDFALTLVAISLVLFSKQNFKSVLKSCKKVLFDGYSWVHIDKHAIFRLSDDLSEDYKRRYSLKADIYYFFRYMFIS